MSVALASWTGSESVTSEPNSQQDRRHKPRSKLGLTARVRPSDPHKDDHFDDVLSSLNASQDGIYFATWREVYYEAMRLFVTYPYSTSAPSVACEYIGQIVRVDRLTDGRCGVAVQLVACRF